MDAPQQKSRQAATPDGLNHGRGINYTATSPQSQRLDADQVKSVAQRRWREILGRLAPELSEAINKMPRHVACPVHGGRDGFRLFADESGGGICNSCGSFPDGFSLLQWLRRWAFPETLQEVASVLGMTRDPYRKAHVVAQCPPNPSPPNRDSKAVLERLRATWAESLPLDHPEADPVRRYMVNRGLGEILSDLPSGVRCHPLLSYWLEGREVGRFPTMLALVQDLAGRGVSLHRTYLASDGIKAQVPEPKKLMKPIRHGATRGAAIRLYHSNEKVRHLEVAEGVETSLAVRAATGAAVWATITAGGMAALQLPAGIRTVDIWADLDRTGVGQQAAIELARRLTSEGRVCRILVPPGPILDGSKGVDWLDVLNGESARKEAG
ncbi:MAG: toprim domain-containing protein [Magnetococcales bacterium]|nr:toprim domain-containing protein [Magnetococcales bacterium]